MPEVSEFFAVTVSGSMYHIRVNPDQQGDPIVEKVAGVGSGGLLIGARLNDGYCIGITNYGILKYYPSKSHGGRTTSAWMTNIRNHGGKTSRVVALFLDYQMARICMEQRSNTPWDHQWMRQTKETLQAIGRDHERFIIDENVPGIT